MTYNINKTNGDLLAVIPDGEVDLSSSIKLVGRNYPGYGEIMNENLVAMMEHFSNDSPPINPVTGQLWHNSTDGTLSFFDKTGTWSPIEVYSNDTRPRLLSVIDTAEVEHSLLAIYVSKKLVAVISGSPEFTPIRDRNNLSAGVTVESFPIIKPGINMNVNPSNTPVFKMVGYVTEAEMIETINTSLAASGGASADALRLISDSLTRTNNNVTELQNSLNLMKENVDTALANAGGATGGGTDKVFYENGTVVTTNYTITTGKNAMSAGPILIDNGVTVTVPDNSSWTIV